MEMSGDNGFDVGAIEEFPPLCLLRLWPTGLNAVFVEIFYAGSVVTDNDRLVACVLQFGAQPIHGVIVRDGCATGKGFRIDEQKSYAMVVHLCTERSDALEGGLQSGCQAFLNDVMIARHHVQGGLEFCQDLKTGVDFFWSVHVVGTHVTGMNDAGNGYGQFIYGADCFC